MAKQISEADAALIAKFQAQRNAKKAAPATTQMKTKTISIEIARKLCPDALLAERVATRFGLDLPEFDSIRAIHRENIHSSAQSFDGALNEKALEMHCQRLVASYLSSAVGAGRFYSEKVDEAKATTTSLLNVDRDIDRDDIAGLENKAERTRQFAAEKAMQAYALLAAAEGAIQAYKDVTGDDWKAYVAPVEGPARVERRSAAEELAAFN